MDSLRLSDADRESAVELLSEQYALGRLTKEEFDERSDAVWSAKTQGDLAPVFVDLPVGSPSTPARRSGWPPSGRRRFPVSLAPVLFLVVAITVITHPPFVLFGLLAWFVLSRRYAVMCPPWRGHADRAH
ncbi:MAG: DUF1707 domain-containing protein [Marmoricola sp.]